MNDLKWFMDNIDVLVEKIKKLETTAELQPTEFLTDTDIFNNLSEKLQLDIRYIMHLCIMLFIMDNGHPNTPIILELKKKGYTIEKGEADSFGWLSAILTTSKGKIVFDS